MKFKTFIFLCMVWVVVYVLVGCEGFARKFVRKQKPQDKKEEDIVLVPQEYKSQELNQEELYRQYFLYWESWQNELIDSLSSRGSNRKKQIDCLREAVKNLVNMKDLLKPDKQVLLGNYINEMNALGADITKDIYENYIGDNLLKAQHIKRKIQHDFSFSKMKDYLL